MAGRALLPYLFLVPGVIMALWGAWVMHRASGPSKWPAEKGRVVSSTMEPRGEGADKYVVTIRYEYEVEGTPHTSETGKIPARTREEAEKLVSRNQPGTPILVDYDPRDPSVSLLELEMNFPYWAVTVLIAGMLLATLGGVLLSRKG